MDGTSRARPRIRCAQPVRGEREPFCRTDEASVSRMLSGRYSGMVERLQDMDGARGMSFQLYHADGKYVSPYQVSPREPANHVMRFLALRFARSMFPQNFIDARELRISALGGRAVSAMYSGYVEDGTGVIARRADFMRRYYEADGRGERDAIQAKFDSSERASCPDLDEAMRDMELSGIIIPHPEANYHACGGNVVFFEVLGIRLRRAFAFANELSANPEESLALLSLMYAAMLRHYSRANPSYFAYFEDYHGFCLHDISNGVLGTLAELASFYPQGNNFFESWFFKDDIHSALHQACGRAKLIKSGLVAGPQGTKWPVSIEPSLV
ncbi:MAG: hypothetical protein AB1529_02390 [Candidatus Micrarchaeota archaeon]